MRGDHVRNMGINVPTSIEPFIAPFDPDAVLKPGWPLDFVHEREWRLPTSLEFEYSDVEVVLVNTVKDVGWLLDKLDDKTVLEDRLIPMHVYFKIKRTWGD
jgi:hypothetical protein